MNKQQKTAVNMAKFIQVQSLFLLDRLKSWIWIMRLISARNSMRMRNAFTEACQRA